MLHEPSLISYDVLVHAGCFLLLNLMTTHLLEGASRSVFSLQVEHFDELAVGTLAQIEDLMRNSTCWPT